MFKNTIKQFLYVTLQEKANATNILGKYVYCAGGSIARNSGAVNKKLTIQGECVKKQRRKEQNEKKKSGADPDVASGVRLIGKLRGIIYYMLLMVKQSVGRGHPTAPGQ
ncbi:MAG: hypothetical protein ACLRX3_14015 [Subdoligranulum sp.]